MMDRIAGLDDDDAAGARLRGLLANASIEVTSRDPAAVDALAGRFMPGTYVHVTFLPDDDPRQAADACLRLRRAGFEPTPHLTARNFRDLSTLDDHLARISGEAGVTRALVIAGDVDSPRGPFATSLDLLQTGLLEKYGFRSILLAGHPEGHPIAREQALDRALIDKLAFARAHGLDAEIVTQFGFEAEPILSWINHIRAFGVHAPVRVGVAGPAGTATLLKYAVRCGVGNSMRMLKKRAGAIGKLMTDTAPDELVAGIAEGSRAEERVAGLHIYMFGGARKTAEWLADARARAARPLVGDRVS